MTLEQGTEIIQQMDLMIRVLIILGGVVLFGIGYSNGKN